MSHDRWFVSRLATRILELTPEGFSDYPGSYEEYVASCGDDHLDVDTATLRQRRSRKRGDSRVTGRRKSEAAGRRRRRDLELRRDVVTAAIQKGENRIEEINQFFCKEGFFENETPERVRSLEEEQQRHRNEVERLMAEWEEIENELEDDTSD